MEKDSTSAGIVAPGVERRGEKVGGELRAVLPDGWCRDIAPR